MQSSTSALGLVDRNVVDHVCESGRRWVLKAILCRSGTGVDEGVDLGWGETFGGPVVVHLVEQVPLVSLICLAKSLGCRMSLYRSCAMARCPRSV
jgi:hypothetical protein